MIFSVAQFVVLHTSLRDPYSLPAKRTLTNLVPSAWVNDDLIMERKEGLILYLHSLLQSAELQDHPILIQFLMPGPFAPFGTPQIRHDALTVPMESRSMASISHVQSRFLSIKSESDHDEAEAAGSVTPVAGTYYPSWAGSSLPPEKLAFAKYDIIFFGMQCLQ